MIIHKLIASFVRVNRTGNNKEFFLLQAHDTIKWLQRSGIEITRETEVLDLGCGHGEVGGELAKMGCKVIMSDDESFVRPEYKHLEFRPFNIDKDDFGSLGQYDLVVCSNVLEHLPRPDRLIKEIPKLMKPSGRFYLSWTNWLSPFGGHEYTPFHYLGIRFAEKAHKRWSLGQRIHKINGNLFPTYIGPILGQIKANPELKILRRAPRYYPEFPFIMYLPGVREFLAWNCTFLIARN